MAMILLAYAAVLALCVAFLDILGPAKDFVVIAAFIAVSVAIWRAKPRRSVAEPGE